MVDVSGPPVAVVPDSAHPVSLSVTRPPGQSRLTNFPFFGFLIRLFVGIPHFVILYFFQIVMMIVYFIASFAILFTGVYPRGMFEIVEGYFRWLANVQGFVMHLYDTYPPFAMAQQDYPLRAGVAYPAQSNRVLNFPVFGFVIKGFALIPHLIVVAMLGFATFWVLVLGTFAILFTGAFPEGLHGFASGVLRWGFRLSAYLYGLTDRYPPFTLSA